MKTSLVFADFVLAFLVLLILPVQAVQQNSQVVVATGVIGSGTGLGWLHTDGKYIKNELGQVVLLRGVAITDLSDLNGSVHPPPFGVSEYWGQANGTFQEGYGYLPNSFDLLKSAGVNCVRLALNWYVWMGIVDSYDPTDNIIFPSQMDDYRQATDLFIQELANRGIYSYIDFHNYNMYASSDLWKNFVDNQLSLYEQFWTEIATRYKNQPYMMGCEIMNEPRDFFDYYPYHGYWWNFSLQTARTIHSVNPNLLVLIPSTDNTCNGTQLSYPFDAGYKVVGDQFVNNPLPEPNIVYTCHPYFANDFSSSWDVWQEYVAGNLTQAKALYEKELDVAIFRAIDRGLPVINTEFNIKHYSVYDYSAYPFPYLNGTADFLDIMNKHGCGWNWWGWSGSVGYPWDLSPDSNSLVYATYRDSIYNQPIWNKLSYVGEVWSEFLEK